MDRLKKITEQIELEKKPPVHLWKPEFVGEIDIRIDAQGFWFHEGEPFQRLELVRLFASILWFEEGQHYLVTPVEKLAIEVEDSPFVVHQMQHIDEQWLAVTNLHEQLFVSAEHPVELREYLGQLIPYIRVRYDLWARVNRSIYYQWVTAAMERQASTEASSEIEEDNFMLISAGYKFKVAEEINE